MKKTLALILIFMLGVSILAGCNGGGGSSRSSGPERLDAGDISVEVPSGWKGYLISESMTPDDTDYRTNQIEVYKGADSFWDIYIKPGLRIVYYGAGREMDNPDYFFSDPETLPAMELGGRTWNGYKGFWLDEERALLWTEDGVHQIRIEVVLESDGKISLSDADVRAIIASIELS